MLHSPERPPLHPRPLRLVVRLIPGGGMEAVRGYRGCPAAPPRPSRTPGPGQRPLLPPGVGRGDGLPGQLMCAAPTVAPGTVPSLSTLRGSGANTHGGGGGVGGTLGRRLGEGGCSGRCGVFVCGTRGDRWGVLE